MSTLQRRSPPWVVGEGAGAVLTRRRALYSRGGEGQRGCADLRARVCTAFHVCVLACTYASLIGHTALDTGLFGDLYSLG